MNKGLLSIFFCGMGFWTASGQITITQADMPKAKDTLRYSNASFVGVNLQLNKKGAAQSWDYSSLVPVSQGIYDYKSANTTSYAFYFFNQIGLLTTDTLGAGPVTFTDIYSFYSKSSTVFKAEGIGYKYSGIPLASNYADDDEIYQFPLTYGDSDVSKFNFKFTIPGGQINFSYVQAGTRTNVVEGYGSIKTPFKTYNDAIKVVSYVNQVDSIITQFGKVGVPRRRIEYKWLTNNERIPVLEIVSNEVTNGNYTVAYVRFRDQFRAFKSPFAPVASFTYNKYKGIAGLDTFYFYDNSSNNPNAWNWYFSPATGVEYLNGTQSNSRNPIVKFNSSGFYDVRLVAQNLFGNDDTLVSNCMEIEKNIGVNFWDLKNNKIFPNPSSNMVSLIISDIEKPTINVFDMAGKKLQWDWKFDGQQWNAEILSIPAGLYIVGIQEKPESFTLLRVVH